MTSAVTSARSGARRGRLNGSAPERASTAAGLRDLGRQASGWWRACHDRQLISQVPPTLVALASPGSDVFQSLETCGTHPERTMPGSRIGIPGLLMLV